MDQVALPNRLFAQSNDIEILVLADCRAKVKLAFNFMGLHHLVIILVADLFVKQRIAFVLLSVRSYIPCVLGFDACPSHNLRLLFLSFWRPANLAPSEILGGIERRENTWCEVLCIEDTHFSLVCPVDQNED